VALFAEAVMTLAASLALAALAAALAAARSAARRMARSDIAFVPAFLIKK
jgi:hypothetical protein